MVAVPLVVAVTVAVVLRAGDGGGPAPVAATPPAVSATTNAADTGNGAPSSAPSTPASTPPAATSATATPPAAGSVADKSATLISASDTAACAGNTKSKLVVVSLSTQHVTMCQKGKAVQASAATSGNVKAGDATPTGTWRVYSKQRDRYLRTAGKAYWVQYWIPFNGNYGFHDASWQKFAFGSPKYTTDGSHGCIHLPVSTMKWLYSWSRVGTTVVTIEK